MAQLIKFVDVSAGTGQIIHEGQQVARDDTVFRIVLPNGYIERANRYCDLTRMSAIDRSTVARLCGTELPRQVIL